jgi:hypothetical protein
VSLPSPNPSTTPPSPAPAAQASRDSQTLTLLLRSPLRRAALHRDLSSFVMPRHVGISPLSRVGISTPPPSNVRYSTPSMTSNSIGYSTPSSMTDLCRDLDSSGDSDPRQVLASSANADTCRDLDSSGNADPRWVLDSSTDGNRAGISTPLYLHYLWILS